MTRVVARSLPVRSPVRASWAASVVALAVPAVVPIAVVVALPTSITFAAFARSFLYFWLVPISHLCLFYYVPAAAILTDCGTDSCEVLHRREKCCKALSPICLQRRSASNCLCLCYTLHERCLLRWMMNCLRRGRRPCKVLHMITGRSGNSLCCTE